MGDRAELHFHLLPGVDDGPATMEEAVELARMAVDDGTSTVVATPHVREIDPRELPRRVEALVRRLGEDGVPLEVRCGGELAFDDVAGLGAADLQTMAQGPAGAPWLLLEAPLEQVPATADDLLDAAQALRDRGYGILLGHPERSPALFDEDLRGLRAELAAGAVPQINATSLLGEHGEDCRVRALAVVGLCDAAVVASDAHRPTRGPALTAAERVLRAAGVPAARAREMTAGGPRRLLERGLPAGVSPRAALLG